MSKISIHTLRMEGDQRQSVTYPPYPPISIHTLRMEGDPEPVYARVNIPPISIHTLRMEGDKALSVINRIFSDFNPHPPYGG